MLSAGKLRRLEDCEMMRLARALTESTSLAEKPIESEQKDHKDGGEYPRGPMHPVI
jgi:hypothetical protein